MTIQDLTVDAMCLFDRSIKTRRSPLSRPCIRAFIFSAVFASIGSAQDAVQISYQGTLASESGQPMEGSVPLHFALFDGAGAEVWSESHQAVPVSDGVFDVVLGSVAELPASAFDGGPRYLSVRLGVSGPALSPPTLLTESPGAAVARRVSGDVKTEPGMLILAGSNGNTAVGLSAGVTDHIAGIGLVDPTEDKALVGIVGVQTNSTPAAAEQTPAFITQPLLRVEANAATEESSIRFKGSPSLSAPTQRDVLSISGSPLAGADIYLFNPQPEPPAPALHLFSNDDGGAGLRLNDDRGDQLLAVSNSPDAGPGIFLFNPQPEPPRLAAEFAAGAGSGPRISLYGDAGKIAAMEPLSAGNGFGFDVFQPSGSSTLVGMKGIFGDKPYGEVRVYDRTDSRETRMQGGTLLMRGALGDEVGPAILLSATQSQAMVGIGTDSPTHALTVMGDGWFSGEVLTFTQTVAKQDVEPIRGALDKVSAINGYTYTYRKAEYPALNLPAGRRAGLLAEEVEAVLPEVVGRGPAGRVGVSYGRVAALLVEAVKELRARNERLEARIAALESRLDGSN